MIWAVFMANLLREILSAFRGGKARPRETGRAFAVPLLAGARG